MPRYIISRWGLASESDTAMLYRRSHQILSSLVAWTFSDAPAFAPIPVKAERPSVTQAELRQMFAAELYGRA